MVCKITKQCPSCLKEITSNNYKKHVFSCESKKPPKIRGVDFDPNRGYKNGSRVAWNKGLNKQTSEAVLRQSQKLKQGWEQGIYEPTGAMLMSKEKLSQIAKDRKLGGYREGAGRSKKFKVTDSFGKQTTVQSSYELSCSKILDEIGVRWIRPQHLVYEGKKYFPDFFLVDHSIYLDPKNSFLKIKDREKIESVKKQNNVQIFVLDQDQINKDYIQSLLTCSSEERAES